MGKLAVFKFGYFVTVLFSIFMLALSLYALHAGTMDPTYHTFAAYVAAGKMVIIAINALLLIYWLIRFRCWVWLPVIGLAANYSFVLSIWNPLPHHPDASGQTLRVLTYNVHYFGNEITGFSAKEFKELMDERKVDIACFQEYVGNADFTYDDLRDLYSSTFSYNYQPKENMDKIIYSRYPIINSDCIQFEKSNNGAIWADIDVSGHTVRVINVHMQTTTINRMKRNIAKARLARDEEREQELYMNFTDNMFHNLTIRSQQARIVAKLIEDTPYPVILCGDFNDTPGTYTYHTLKGDLKDGFSEAGSGYSATFREFYNLLRIDYIFHSSTLTGIHYETIPYEMSDHNPVFMEMGF